jgi:hypothetical protein
MGRSKGGLSTKIHAWVDALGNPIGFHLTPGQACDLDGADVLLNHLAATRFWQIGHTMEINGCWSDWLNRGKRQ